MIYTRIILDTRKRNDGGVYPVKIRITFNRRQKYYLTGFKMTEKDFEEAFKQIPAKKLRPIRIQLDHQELKVRNIISGLDVFCFSLFEEKFYENKNAAKSIYSLYEETISAKINEGKISTAINYRCSMNSLKAFDSKLAFADITPALLKKYEKHLLEDGKSISTVGIYLRPLRAIINDAIARKFLPIDRYPFGLKKYVIPESRNIKKALCREDFKKVLQYVPADDNSFKSRAKDFWLLSYLCQGINPKDILLLKKKSIEGDFIKFIREKTKDTGRAGISEITVPALPEIKAIIEKWRVKDDSTAYLFGFIKEGMSPLDVHKTVQQFVKNTNKHMGRIARELGIEKKITCYTARFQFTKTMIDANMSVEYLRQCLGHQSTTTTQRYIGSFENEKKFEIAGKYLLNFRQ